MYDGRTNQGDGAAVVAKSVRDLYADHPKYDVQLLAIVHRVTTVKMLPMLRRSGYRILQRDVPVRVDELENPVYRERAPTSGCCGLSELLKLEGWALVRRHSPLAFHSPRPVISFFFLLRCPGRRAALCRRGLHFLVTTRSLRCLSTRHIEGRWGHFPTAAATVSRG